MRKKIFNDVLNDFVEVEYPPRKVVSLDPASTETLFMIGAGELVVGTDAFSYRPQEARNRVKLGSYTHVKYEILDQLKPDIIFTTLGAQKDLTLELKRRGYPVYPLRVATTVGEILNNILLVGNASGRHESSRLLYRSLLNRLNTLPSPKIRPAVYVELDLGGPITPGFPSHISDGIWLAGGKNVFDHLTDAYVEPSSDQLMELQIDLVIYEPKKERQEELQRFKDSLRTRGLFKLLDVPMYVTKGDFLAHQGPSFVQEVIPWINEVIFSWLQTKK
ncbi:MULTISPECIES: ABC transporter substrate-binding protein [Metallosphaera]|uniref:ABC transporter substrate-binding protein n=1 Tax=Metallosphaera TaxID=41980 RepID=UPI001EDD3162|nr:ABC transporter substrate-binding protein [Metallosphaera javensis (ex Hofmann et al. 2022)]